MPPALACKFTVSELAVLRIIGDEVRQHGQCDRCVDEIAARAGVCRRMVQNAIREAARLGLLTVEELRPRRKWSIFGLTRGQVFGEEQIARLDHSPALPDVAARPSGGLFRF